jgi:dTDP-4-amino-4,6-dideoxygalactose transaminase
VADVDPMTWELTASTVMAAIETTRPAAIMPVRVFGLMRNLSELADLAAGMGIPLVIDAAAALGGDRETYPIECDYVEVFSLHATKSFGIGEGGAMFANAKYDGALRRAINFGLLPDRTFGLGFNGKMSEFQAAVGLSVLEIYNDLIDGRRRMGMQYTERLRERSQLRIPSDVLLSACSNFPILMPENAPVAEIEGYSHQNGVQVRRYYYPSLASGQREGHVAAPTPVADDLSRRMLCLPLYAEAGAQEVDEIMCVFDQAGKEFGLWN